MPIDATTATRIARRHHLSMLDAAGLLHLADDHDDAERLAALFAETIPTTDTTTPERTP